MSKKSIIVSGIKPTGNLQLGNYLGAVKNFVELQNSNKYEMYIFIADLHSLTGGMNGKERHEQILKTVAELLAAGLDPDKVTFLSLCFLFNSPHVCVLSIVNMIIRMYLYTFPYFLPNNQYRIRPTNITNKPNTPG